MDKEKITYRRCKTCWAIFPLDKLKPHHKCFYCEDINWEKIKITIKKFREAE